jgi:predicted metalloprotease with PDZ domain
MRGFQTACVAAAALLSIGAAKPAAPVIDYVVSPEMHGADLAALDVTMRLRADASGVTRLKLPDESAGTTELWRYLRDIKVEGAASVAEDGPAVRVVRSAPRAELTVRYRVVSAYDRDPDATNFDTYKPTIRPHWFWIYGEAAFIQPAEGEPLARFAWRGAPKDFPFASDLEHAGGKPMSQGDLLESVLVGGPDLKLYSRAADGPLRVAVVGRYPFTGQAFADETTRVIAAERRFWRAKEGAFLVVLAPLTVTPSHKSTRGEGRGDAFAIMSTPDMREDLLKTILAHEYFHTWNPRRMGEMHSGDQERADYWFSEGFTDFYGWRLLLKSGELDPKAFAGIWNEMLLAYANSPAKDAPGAKIVDGFWKDRSVEKLPYQRGAILAAKWDRELRDKSGGRVGLDDVVRAMAVRARALGPKSPKAPDLFVEVARTFGLDVKADVDAVIAGGAPALLPPNAFGTCLPVHTATTPAFDYGFDIDATRKTNTITGLKSGSPAYAAGLRDGMTYVKRESGATGDSRQPIALRIKDKDEERVISYSAAGATTITLQELVPRQDISPPQLAACVAEATGGGPIRAAAASR